MLAVNPFENLDLLGGHHEEVRRQKLGVASQVYGTAECAYQYLKQSEVAVDRRVGRVGKAGKTETNKHLMYLAYRSKAGSGIGPSPRRSCSRTRCSRRSQDVAQQQLVALGKFIKILIDKKGNIVGAKMNGTSSVAHVRRPAAYPPPPCRPPARARALGPARPPPRPQVTCAERRTVLPHRRRHRQGGRGASASATSRPSSTSTSRRRRCRRCRIRCTPSWRARSTCGVSADEQTNLRAVVAGVLNINNIDFTGDDNAKCRRRTGSRRARSCWAKLEGCLTQRSLGWAPR